MNEWFGANYQQDSCNHHKLKVAFQGRHEIDRRRRRWLVMNKVNNERRTATTSLWRIL